MSDDHPPAPIIDDAAVAHVARLSRLELTPEEQRMFRAQLGGILESFRKLVELDLSGIPPAAQASPATGTMRDDVPAASLTRDEALANAPAVEDGYVVVPPVIEEEGAGAS